MIVKTLPKDKYQVNILTILFLSGIVTKSCGLNAIWVCILALFAAYLGVSEFRQWAKLNLPLGVIVAAFIMLTSTLLGDYRDGGQVNNIIYTASFCMMLFIFYVLTSRNCSYIVKGLKQVNYLLILFALFGIYEYLIRDNPLKGLFETYYNLPYVGSDKFRSCSVFAHSIPFAVSMLIGIVTSYYLSNSKTYKFLSILIFVLALFCSKSRSCWIVFVIMILGIVITELRDRGFNKTALIVAPICIVSAVIVAQPVVDAVLNRFSGLMSSGSFLHRSGAAEYILQKFISEGNMLIGSGYGSAEYEMSQTVIFEIGFNTVDNGLITLLYDFGLIVIGLLAAALCIAVFRYFDPRSNYFEKCICMIFLVTLATGYVFEFFGWQCISVFFFMTVIYVVYCKRDCITGS